MLVKGLPVVVMRLLLLTYVEVLDVELGVFGKVVVLLCHENSLLEERLVDLLAVGLGDKPVV
jgi:hypothetical protein